MLVLLPQNSFNNEREGSQDEDQTLQGTDFPDFSVDTLLDTLDFDDFLVGINDGDLLHHLQIYPETFPEFSLTAAEDSSDFNAPESGTATSSESSVSVQPKDQKFVQLNKSSLKEARRSSTRNLTGKKKVKVDWTPELHRRFVQAVEQLGIDKAVPSRIVELMGIDCLTRHNVASHLQKYRSQRKHLLAREAEAANWNQRRHIYGGSGSAKKDHVSPWITPPTIGFPPVPHFRPLHVWGHPSVDQSSMHMWQTKHLSQPPAHAWAPSAQPPNPLTPADPSLWIPHHHVPTPGTPCFSPHLQPPAIAPRFPAMPFSGIPQPAGFAVAAMHHGQALPQPPLSDIHPLIETVDAAIGDVLSKPWMPLPLGLKPPTVDSVMFELQRQGISKIPPSSRA